MRIPNKFNGYSADNRRLYNFGGGGGPNTTTAYQTNIPEYAQPYVEQMLGATQRQLFTGKTDAEGKFIPTGFNNFTPYGATYQRDAKGNPLRDARGNVMYTNTAMDQAAAALAPLSAGQQMATNTINQYVAPEQTAAASQLAADIAGRSAAAGYYSPMQAERFAIGAPQQIAAQQVAAQRITPQQQIAASRVSTDSFTSPNVSQGYMSPYMQNVVDIQQREARRAGETQRMQNQARAIGSGAFGGSRQALVEAERQRNLSTQLGDIQAQGLQQAYQQGMGQFNAEQAAYLQAQQANQQAGLTAQQANLQAGMTAQQANQQAGLAAQQANQQAGMTAQQANQQMNMQRAIQNMQALQAAQAAQEQSRQFGAGLGLQGYGQSLQAAQTLGQLGQQQYGQEMGTIQAMSQLGAQEQAYRQAIINQAIQNYSMQQQYPLMQLGVMSNMLRGLPMQASTTEMYQAQPSPVSQVAGAVGTGLGLVQQYNKAFPGGKEGGVVKTMAAGGIATGVPASKLEAMLKRPNFTDDVLQQKASDPQTDQVTKGLVAAEMARRANLRSGMATGGIVAFKKGKKVVAKNKEDIPTDTSNLPGYPVSPDYAEEFERGSAAGIDQDIPTDTSNLPGYPVSPDYAEEFQRGSAAGIVPNVPTAKVHPLAELEATTNEEMQRQKALRDEAKGDKIKRFQQEREAMGLADPANREREMLEARRKRGEKSEQETAQNNLIRFLTKWGTIPGSTIRGLVTAGADLVDKMDLDEKHRQKFLDGLDDIESKINSAEYARRLGDEGRAREEQQKAGELYFKLGHDLRTAKVNYAIKEMDAASKYEIAALKAEIAANKQQNKAPIIQMADKEFEGLVAAGEPANAITYRKALKSASSMLPGVQAAEIGYGPRAASAGADVSRALTAQEDARTRQQEAETRESEEKRKRLKDAREATDDEISSKTFRTQLKTMYDKEGANTPAAKAAIRRREEARVLEEKKVEYGVAPAKPAPAASAPPAAAPKGGAPVLRWDPKTNQYVKP